MKTGGKNLVHLWKHDEEWWRMILCMVKNWWSNDEKWGMMEQGEIGISPMNNHIACLKQFRLPRREKGIIYHFFIFWEIDLDILDWLEMRFFRIWKYKSILSIDISDIYLILMYRWYMYDIEYPCCALVHWVATSLSPTRPRAETWHDIWVSSFGWIASWVNCLEWRLSCFIVQCFTLWLCQNSYWKWPFIVSFTIKHGDFP